MKVCQWAKLNYAISTSCGKEAHFYGEDMKFCPFCGRKLVYKTMPKTLKELEK